MKGVSKVVAHSSDIAFTNVSRVALCGMCVTLLGIVHLSFEIGKGSSGQFTFPN